MSRKQKRRSTFSQPGLLVVVLLFAIAFINTVDSSKGGRQFEEKAKAGQKAGNGSAAKCRGDKKGAGCLVADLVRADRLRFGGNPTLDFKAATGQVHYRYRPDTDIVGPRVTYHTVDRRVWQGLRVLADSMKCRGKPGAITVSNLVIGHRWESRPGVVSAHSYGSAADISAVRRCGKWYSISYTMQRSSWGYPIMLRLVRACMSTGARQCISLLAIGGTSMYLADHDDHLHMGF